MTVRVQVILDDDERARFRRCAAEEGRSLSAWLRDAGRQRLAGRDAKGPMTADGLRAFFDACDQREAGEEPDWDQHVAVIAQSRRSGSSGT